MLVVLLSDASLQRMLCSALFQCEGCRTGFPSLLLQFPIWKTSHTIKWEGVWRELGCLSRTASFAVRKESGHSLKSSLSVRLALWVEKCVDTALDPLVVSAHMGLSEVTLRGQPGGWDSDFQFHCLILFLISNISGKRLTCV